MSVVRIASILMALCALPAIAQMSMGRPGMTPLPPPARRLGAPVNSGNPAALTEDQQRRLATLMKQMSGKQRKKLSQAIQHMTPQQRRQFIALLQQQLGKAPPAPKGRQAGRR